MKKQTFISAKKFAAALLLSAAVLPQTFSAFAWKPTAAEWARINQTIAAQTLAEEADYAGAEASYTALLASNGNNFEVYAMRAQARLEQGNTEGAFADYAQAVQKAIAQPDMRNADIEKYNAYMASIDAVDSAENAKLWIQYLGNISVEQVANDESELMMLQSTRQGVEMMAQNLSTSEMEALFAQYQDILAQDPEYQQVQQQMSEIQTYKKQTEQEKEAERSVRRSLRAKRQQAEASLTSTLINDQGEHYQLTVQYGNAGLQVKENFINGTARDDKDFDVNETGSIYRTALYILSQGPISVQEQNGNVVCTVPTGTEIWEYYTEVDTLSSDAGYDLTPVTVRAGQAVKLRDGSGVVSYAYCEVTFVGV